MKKLVIIGANDFQNQLILKAKSMGLETHVFAWAAGDEGEKTADFFYPISIVEKEAILQKCKAIRPDGVISVASDLASVTVNYLAEQLGLVGNSMESTLISTNKYFMRKAFAQNGDPSPRFYRSDELDEAVLSDLRFPLIIKPTDRSGSRGITKVERPEDLPAAIQVAKDLSFDKRAMIEEFVEGEEYSVEYVSYQGKHHFLALTQKFTTGAPHFIETGHRQPAAASDALLTHIQSVIEHALDTLKIQYGASHSEIKIDANGSLKIIEIGGRMGGDCIGSDLVWLSTGYDFLKMVIQIACGEAPELVPTGEKHIAEIKFIFNQADLDELEAIKKNRPGSLYRVSRISYDHLGKTADSSTRSGYYILLDDLKKN